MRRGDKVIASQVDFNPLRGEMVTLETKWDLGGRPYPIPLFLEMLFKQDLSPADPSGFGYFNVEDNSDSYQEVIPQSNDLQGPIPCKTSNIFQDKRVIMVDGVPLQVWGEMAPDKLDIFEKGMNSFADQISSDLFRFLFYGDNGPTLKFITTHEKNILLANKCVDEEYPEFGGPLFHPPTWTVYFSGESLGIAKDKTIETLYGNQMVNIIHELMHVLDNRLGLRKSEMSASEISSKPIFSYFSDEDPINGFVLHYYHVISQIFDSPEDHKKFVRIQQRKWSDHPLTAEEQSFFDNALPEIKKRFVTVYSVFKYYEYFAEAGAAYFNVEAGDVPDIADEKPKRRRGMLKSTDPVLHLVFKRFFSNDSLDRGAFSVDSFRKAYEDLGMEVPSAFLKQGS